MDPEGRSRTGISAVDSCVLYLLSYLGVVLEMLRTAIVFRKMAESATADSAKSETAVWPTFLVRDAMSKKRGAVPRNRQNGSRLSPGSSATRLACASVRDYTLTIDAATGRRGV